MADGRPRRSVEVAVVDLLQERVEETVDRRAATRRAA
jgi:hypothetical protein